MVNNAKEMHDSSMASVLQHASAHFAAAALFKPLAHATDARALSKTQSDSAVDRCQLAAQRQRKYGRHAPVPAGRRRD